MSKYGAVPAALAMLWFATPGSAAELPEQGDIKELRPGLTVETLPQTGYYHHACGSNGGPPKRPIDGWADFKTCAPEPTGLHEVYVEMDDEALTIARADPDANLAWLEKFSGTKVGGHSVILSLLFDDNGAVQGLRAVTDPRVDVDQRRSAHTLRLRVLPRYRRNGWACVDAPLAEGETPIGDMHIKQRCETVYDDMRRVIVWSRLYRRPGQTGVDANNFWVPGEFESSTRLEILHPSVPVLDRVAD